MNKKKKRPSKKSGVKCVIPFIEMSVADFISTFKDGKKVMFGNTNHEIIFDVLKDREYIVRVAPLSFVELGYKEDYWQIGGINWKKVEQAGFIEKYYPSGYIMS